MGDNYFTLARVLALNSGVGSSISIVSLITGVRFYAAALFSSKEIGMNLFVV
jgi:hypothetical protein